MGQFQLEHHLAQTFDDHHLAHARKPRTENNAEPDFLFPGVAEYRNPSFPAARLTMLGAKSTCKDRWRQVLTEADRISQKHLFTLEPGISVGQTAEMQAHGLALVIPVALHPTYTPDQIAQMLTLGQFIRLAAQRQ